MNKWKRFNPVDSCHPNVKMSSNGAHCLPLPKHGFDLILLMWCEFELAPKLDASVLC